MWFLGECSRIRVFISRKSSLEDASKICSNPAENVSRRDTAAAPSPPLIFSLPLSLPLFFATHETGRRGKGRLCCSLNAVCVHEETHQSIEANFPRGEKISPAHIMTNSCRLFGLRHDNGVGGPWEGMGMGRVSGKEGGGRMEKVMAALLALSLSQVLILEGRKNRAQLWL